MNGRALTSSHPKPRDLCVFDEDVLLLWVLQVPEHQHSKQPRHYR